MALGLHNPTRSAYVFLPLLALLVACTGHGASEEDIQQRVDEAVAEALADEQSAATSTASASTTSPVLATAASSSTTSSTTTTTPTTTTLDLLDPGIVRERFLVKADDEISRVAPRLPVEGMTPDHSAEYQPPYLFDIETTDSIVSPYKGTLVIPIVWYYQGEPTQLLSIHATYHYTDYEWVFGSAVRYIDETTPDLSPIRTQWVESLFR